MENPFNINDKVYKNYLYDGTPKAGKPDKSIVYTIIKITDHEPCDGPFTEKGCVFLSPNPNPYPHWAFYWNLTKAD